ncbi:MAG: restriction endonuclease subunit S [Thermodesulfobacteriota bacterium]
MSTSTLSLMDAEERREIETRGLPEAWRFVPIEKCVEKTKQVDMRKASAEFKYIDVSGVDRDSSRIVGYSTYRSHDAPSRARKVVRKNDVLVATVRPTLKRIAIIDDEFDNQICSTAFCVLRSDSKVLDSRYLYYAAHTIDFVENLGRLQRGASYPAVTDSDVKRQRIPLPSLQEQGRIAIVLSSIQQSREKTQSAIDSYREMKKSLMKHLFKYGPVCAEDAEKIRVRGTGIGEMPEEWDLVRLDSLVRNKKDIVAGPFGSNIGKRFFVHSGIPVIRGNNLTTGKTMFIDDGFVFITGEKAQELASCEALPGDLVFTAAGTVGQVGIVPENGRFRSYIISNKQMRVRLDGEKAIPKYIFYWFTSEVGQELIISERRGTSIPVINLSIIRNLFVPLPNVSVQRRITTTLSAVDEKIEKLENKKKALDELFKSMLENLMTARIRVNHLDLPEGVEDG